MKVLGCLVVFTGITLAQVPKTAVLGSAQYLTYTAPGFTVTSFTYETRLLSLTTPGSLKYVYTDGAVNCAISATFDLVCTDGPGSASTSISLAARTDVRVRLVRDVSAHILRVEIWNADGNGYAVASITDSLASDVRTVGTGGFFYDGVGATGGGSMGFWRLYSHVTAANSVPPSESPALPGDKGDFQFEGNLADSGTAGLVLSLHGGGSISYVDSPVFPPVSSISENGFPVRSLAAKLLTSSSFSSLLGNGQPNIFWAQTSGPSQGAFSSTTGQSVTFAAPIAGTYGIRLVATDALGIYTPSTVNVGVVATDNNGVVVTGLDAVRDLILGPQLMSGLSPWPYMDYMTKAVAKELKDAAIANPPSLAISTGTLLAGTCQLGTSPTTCIGTGTNYSSVLLVGDRVMILWTSIDGADTGRLIGDVCTSGCPVSAGVLDATHFTLSNFTHQAALGSGYKVYKLGPDIHATINGSDALTWAPYLWQTGQPGSDYWPYYESPMGIRREKYRNGLDEFKVDADTLDKNGWQYGTDHARYGAAPRAYNFESQFLAALDHTGRFPELYALVQYLETAGSGVYSAATNLVNVPNIDVRDMGYQTGAQALGAMTDPDQTRHTSYCSMLDASVAAWITYQDSRGFWPEKVQGYTYAPPYGTSAWRMALAVHNQQLGYDALKDYCGNTSRAASLLPVIQKGVDFTYLYGRSSTRDGYYDIIYPNNGQDFIPVAGTISVSTSSSPNIVTGIGTAFTTDFASPSFIAVPNGGGDFNAHQVLSVQNNTQLTLVDNWGSQAGEINHSGVTAYRTTTASTSCGNSAAHCNAPDRSFIVQFPGIHGWMYTHGGGSTYKTRGDELLSAGFGGPADGPGGVMAPGGPSADGTITFNSEGLFNCVNKGSATSGFCSSNGTAIGKYRRNAFKNFGECCGVPNSQSYLAARLGGLLPADNRTITRDINLASVPTATKHRVTVTLPSGVVVTNTCLAGRCSVVVDARQGSVGLVKSEYLSPADKVLAATDLESLGLASLQ